MFCRRFCRGRKAQGNLRSGASGAELCWQKEPGTTGEVRISAAACSALKHPCSSLCSSRAPAAPSSPCHGTLRQARGLLLLPMIHFKSPPADPSSAHSFSHLSSALSPFFGVQPHSPSEHHTAMELTHCLLPQCHLPCLCVMPFPPHPYSLVFSLKSSPVSSNHKKSHLLQKSSIMHLLLSAVQRYSSERSRNIPLKLLLSPVEVGCCALLQKTSSENPNKTQKKAKHQS